MTSFYTPEPGLSFRQSPVTRKTVQLPVLVLMLMLLFVGKGWGQNPVFSDDFNRGAVVSPLSNGGTPTMTYTTTSTAANPGSSATNLTSGADYTLSLAPNSATPAAGRTYVYGTLSTYSAPFSTTLNTNPGLVTWTFNLRTNRSTALSGFDASQYVDAVVLVANSSDFLASSTKGYVVYMTKGATFNKINLGSFVAGLSLTSGVTSFIGPSSELAANTNFVSVKVTYAPSTNTWQLFVRDDASSTVPGDPTTVTTQVGSNTVNSTNTGVAMTHFGYFWNHSNGAASTNTGRFDNFKVTVVASSAPTIQASNLVFSNLADISLTAGWTNGNGYKRVVKINTSNSFTNPTNGVEPTANATYAGSGEQVVFVGSGNSVNVSGLTGSTEYWFKVYDYYYGSSLSPIYQTSASTDNPKSATTMAGAVAPSISSPTATAITNNTATLGGNITSTGGASITAHGTVWSTSSPVGPGDNPMDDGVFTTGTFTQARTTLPVKSHIFYKAFATNSVNTTFTSEASFYTMADEPTTAAGSLTASTIPGNYNSLNLTWTAATGADGYIIIQRLGASAPGTAPADATGYSIGATLGTGTIAAVVLPGSATSQVISGLAPTTQYTFRIYPFGYDGSNAQTFNYLTSPFPTPASGTTDNPPPTTYTWTGATSNNWTVATNWNPNRTTPYSNDIIQFSSGGSITVTNVPTQTIGQLSISNSSTVELQSAAAISLSISGLTGVDFDVQSGSTLNLAQATNAIVIALNTGATGTVGGAITFTTGPHKLTSVDANGITFQGGSVFTAGAGFSSNAFGTSGTVGSVVFADGSKYIYYAGSNPFALTAPNSIVSWQSGSTYVHRSTGAPSLGNRTYANFEMDEATGTSLTSSSPLTIDNLIVTSGSWTLGVKAQFDIKKNITVASGAAVNFSPTTAGTLMLSGTIAQVIGGDGSITTNSFEAVTVSNSTGVTLTGNLTANGSLAISSGAFTVASGASLITNGTIPTSVNVERSINGWSDDDHGWHLLSSPMTAQSIQPGFVSDPPVSGEDFYSWDEATNTWINSKNNSGAWNSGFDANFQVGKGYLVAYQSSSTKVFAGTLNTTGSSITGLTNSAGANHGWNLLGNPFPSAIKWNDGSWNLNNVTATAKIWDEAGASYVDISGNDIIPALNGFMVETSGSGSLVIPLASRTHSTNAWYKDSEARIILTARDLENNTTQQSVIKVNDQATNGFDNMFDSHFLSGYAPKFYSLIGEEKMSTNVLPDLADNRTIELGFVKNGAGTFNIELNGNYSLPYLKIYLTDKKTGTITELSSASVYTFTAANGDDPNRFRLSFKDATSISDPDASHTFTAYSDNGIVNVISNTTTSGKVVITDMVGRIVSTSDFIAGTPTRIDLQGHSGVYVVSLFTAKGVSNEKIIVK
jgi:hypothetical protein